MYINSRSNLDIHAFILYRICCDGLIGVKFTREGKYLWTKHIISILYERRKIFMDKIYNHGPLPQAVLELSQLDMVINARDVLILIII
jgi:hypothetical protein